MREGGRGTVWVGCGSARQATTSAMCLTGQGRFSGHRRQCWTLKPLGLLPPIALVPSLHHFPLCPPCITSPKASFPPPSLDGGGVGAGRLLVVPLRVRPDKLLDQAQGLQQ